MKNPWIMIAALIGGAAVILGAVGAHIVRGNGGEIRYHDLAVTYQMFHVAALIAVAVVVPAAGKLAHLAGGIFVLGMLLFCGSLYALAWTGQPLGYNVTPTGGMLLIGGWFLLAIAGWQYNQKQIKN